MTAVRALLEREASTRSAALLRIGLALLLWARFALDVAPWSNFEPARLALSASFFASTTLMLVGAWSRVATAWAGATALVMVYGFGPRTMEPWTHHHTTLLAHATALLALTECGRSLSVDRWWGLRRALGRGGPCPPERGPTWGLVLIGFQVSVVYLSSAFDKCNLAFLSGERLQHTLQHLYWGADPVTLPLWEPATLVAAWVVVVLEVALGVGLWSAKGRRLLIPLGLLLHATFYVLLPVGTFSLTMALLYLAYVDPDAVHAAIDELT